jgi:hypothetical protein
VAPSLAADLAPCSACRAELADPADHRFHGETICCLRRGPRLDLCWPDGNCKGAEPIAAACELLAAGGFRPCRGWGVPAAGGCHGSGGGLTFRLPLRVSMSMITSTIQALPGQLALMCSGASLALSSQCVSRLGVSRDRLQ